MTIRSVAVAALLVCGLGLASATTAQAVQPGMRTMIQQGGREHGARQDYAPRRHMHRRGKRSHRRMHRRGR